MMRKLKLCWVLLVIALFWASLAGCESPDSTDGTDGSDCVYFVDARGKLTEIPSQIENGTITFSAPYFATYAVIDTAQTPVD